ncbi:unnamed protein product [Pleuronectes platessa]|uniref:Uncharacterized protein n=1 Tax=Pleuronectes platessa TaxID=8262 RepID=A0A9N7TTY9_PLEPL|nr:unnamed protein product [Pleuronectes platessa]
MESEYRGDERRKRGGREEDERRTREDERRTRGGLQMWRFVPSQRERESRSRADGALCCHRPRLDDVNGATALMEDEGNPHLFGLSEQEERRRRRTCISHRRQE